MGGGVSAQLPSRLPLHRPLPLAPSSRGGGVFVHAPSHVPTTEAGRLFADGGFSTPDGRARFIPTPYRPLPFPTPRPFLLDTGRVRDQWHTMSRTGRVPRLMTHAPEPTLALNPADAVRLGLVPDDLARVETDAGHCTAARCGDRGAAAGRAVRADALDGCLRLRRTDRARRDQRGWTRIPGNRN